MITGELEVRKKGDRVFRLFEDETGHDGRGGQRTVRAVRPHGDLYKHAARFVPLPRHCERLRTGFRFDIELEKHNNAVATGRYRISADLQFNRNLTKTYISRAI